MLGMSDNPYDKERTIELSNKLATILRSGIASDIC